MQTGPVSIPAVSTSLRTDTFSPYRAGGSVFTSQRSLVLWGRSAVIGDLINTPSDSRGRHRARVQRILKPPPLPVSGANASSALQRVGPVIFRTFHQSLFIWPSSMKPPQKKSPLKIFYLVSKYIKPSDKALFKYI